MKGKKEAHQTVLGDRSEWEYYLWAKSVPVGAQLFEARQALGMTQDEFGEPAGILGTTLCSYEKGWRMPHGNTLLRLSKVMETPLIFDPKMAILRDHTHTPRPFKKKRAKAVDKRRPPPSPGVWVDSNFVARHLGTTRSSALRRMHRAGIVPTRGMGMPTKFWYRKDVILGRLEPLNRRKR